ncbi:MAG TPA: ChaN family lipoprotein [Vicinamibacterales bacterium]|nr:ChaN family lipoprotein [Vicinamibacterales bacterium]
MIPALLAAIIPLLQPPPLPPSHPPIAYSYVPQRVFDTRQKAFGDFESMLADLARADVIFIGEQHDDTNSHRLELAVLEGLVRRRVPLVFALEMFERDVQPVLDRYLAGTITEGQFLAASRPWPRYATDYRPLIEFAKAHQIPVIASDVPRPIATEVSKTGMSALGALGTDRPMAAREPQCEAKGDYYTRFLEIMAGGHPPSGDPKAAEAVANNDRFFLAQCLKDETMGESIADASQKYASRRATVVHVNGAFHSDYAQGTAASTARRMSGRRIAVVSMIPVDDIDTEKPDDDDVKLGDYLVYTVSGKQ